MCQSFKLKIELHNLEISKTDKPVFKRYETNPHKL